jgi:hypothetical protein
MGNLFLLLGLLAGGPEPELIRGKAVPVVRFEEAPQVRVTRSGTRIANGIFTGQSKFADGSAAAPSITFTSAPTKGFYLNGGSIAVTHNGDAVYFNSTGVSIPSTNTLDFAGDVFLRRDTANTLAQRNGTNAQTFSVYNTYTDAANYERATLSWSANQFAVATASAGTGVARELVLASGDSIIFAKTGVGNRWFINTSGHFLAATDNTYDIGASGATRPRTGYFGTNVVAGGEGVFTGNVSTDGVFRDLSTGNRLNLSITDGVRVENNGATNTFDITLADWGTKLTPETISYTVGSITPIVTAGAVGKLLIVNVDDGALCEFALRGGAAPVEMSDVAPQCSVVLGTGSSINVYWDAGDARYEMQMNLAATKQLRLMVFGG